MLTGRPVLQSSLSALLRYTAGWFENELGPEGFRAALLTVHSEENWAYNGPAWFNPVQG
jgi:hypothetical protein